MEFIISFLKSLFKREGSKEVLGVNKEVKKDLFSLEQLYAMNNSCNRSGCEAYIVGLNKILPSYSIESLLRISHFLAQIIHESGNFRYSSENLNYSASALRSVFGKYFKTDEEAQEYARQPEKIANRVYANRMGNGPEESGDGWKYRGRGLIQLTGKSNYEACGKDLGLDLVNNPDLIIEDSETAVKVACWFWNKNTLNNYADKDDIVTITKKINGGTNGLDDRKSNLDRCKLTLNSF